MMATSDRCDESDDEHDRLSPSLACEGRHDSKCGQMRSLIRKSGKRSTPSSPSTSNVLTPLHHHHLDPRHRLHHPLLRAENQHYQRGGQSYPYLHPPRGRRLDHNHQLPPRRQGSDRRLDLGNRPDSSPSKVSPRKILLGVFQSADHSPPRAEMAGGFDASSGSAVSLFPAISLGVYNAQYKAPSAIYTSHTLSTHGSRARAAASKSSIERKATAQADLPPHLAVDKIPLRL